MTGWEIILAAAFGITVLTALLFWFTGHDRRWRAGYAQMLADREEQLAGMIADSVGLFRDGVDPRTEPSAITAQSALSTRYYGNFFPDTRSRYALEDLNRYTFICQLARREALVRLLEDARSQGFNAVCGITLETTDIGHTLNASQRAMVIVTATGTGYRLQSFA